MAITKPVLLDSTGQSIVTALNTIASHTEGSHESAEKAAASAAEAAEQASASADSASKSATHASQVDTAVTELKTAIENLPDGQAVSEQVAENVVDINRVKQTLGNYTNRDDVTLTATETGVAISKDGVKISKEGWAIAEFTATKGNEYLFNPGTMSGDVCLFAEKITKQETRNIDYTYTYNTDGTIATAKATYGGTTHTYTYSYTYDEEGKAVSETITDDQTGAIVQALPYQYKTTVGTYQPMTILNASAELPEDGYCRLVSHFQNDTSLTVVVSYNTADADLTMKVVRDGFTASICTQLSNLAKRISNTSDYATNLDETLSGVEGNQEQLIADDKAVPDYTELPLLCGQPPILYGAGTPQESIVPDNWNQYDPDTDTGYQWNGEPSAVGQRYVDTANNGMYVAMRKSYDKTSADYYTLSFVKMV